MDIVGRVTTQFDSALSLHNTPPGRDINLTNWYKYQRHTEIHPNDGGKHIRNVTFFSSILADQIRRGNFGTNETNCPLHLTNIQSQDVREERDHLHDADEGWSIILKWSLYIRKIYEDELK
jgi:hypothetical protein